MYTHKNCPHLLKIKANKIYFKRKDHCVTTYEGRKLWPHSEIQCASSMTARDTGGIIPLSGLLKGVGERQIDLNSEREREGEG